MEDREALLKTTHNDGYAPAPPAHVEYGTTAADWKVVAAHAVDSKVAEEGEVDGMKVVVSERKSSLFEVGSNLVKVAIGVGVMTFPKGFDQAGLIGGLLLVWFVAFMNDYSCRALWRVKKYVSKNSLEATGSVYGSLAYEAFGPWGGFAIAAIIVIHQLGSCVAYLIFIETTMVTVSDALSKPMWVLVTLPALIFFGVQTNLSYLARSSMLSILVLVVSFIVIYVTGFQERTPTVPSNSVFFKDTYLLFFGLAVFAFGLPVSYLNVAETIKKPQQLGITTSMALAFIATLYSLLGILGFALFAESSSGLADNIIFQLKEGTALAAVIKTLMCVTIVVSYPLCFIPTLPVVEGYMEKSIYLRDYWPIKRSIIRILVIFATAGIAIAVPLFSSVVNVIGCLTGSILTFIFPTVVMFMLCRAEMKLWERILSGFIAVFGVVVMILTSIFAIRDLSEKLKE